MAQATAAERLLAALKPDLTAAIDANTRKALDDYAAKHQRVDMPVADITAGIASLERKLVVATDHVIKMNDRLGEVSEHTAIMHSIIDLISTLNMRVSRLSARINAFVDVAPVNDVAAGEQVVATPIPTSAPVIADNVGSDNYLDELFD